MPYVLRAVSYSAMNHAFHDSKAYAAFHEVYKTATAVPAVLDWIHVTSPKDLVDDVVKSLELYDTTASQFQYAGAKPSAIRWEYNGRLLLLWNVSSDNRIVFRNNSNTKLLDMKNSDQLVDTLLVFSSSIYEILNG